MTNSLQQLASRLNLKQTRHSFRGACPVCGYANAFSLRAGRSDGVQLFAACGCNRDRLLAAIHHLVGGNALLRQDRADPASLEVTRQRKQMAAMRLWNGSQPALGSPAELYLAARGLPDRATSTALRFRTDTSHPEGGRLPALIALVSDVTGAPTAVHRTYLRRDGSGKADVSPVKASLGPVWGGAIRLDPLSHRLVIGEGIETAASAGALLGLPAWSAISAGNLAHGLILPADVLAVVIAADPDEAGQYAAREALRRWSEEGRLVRIVAPIGKGDFNDMLLVRRSTHA